MRTTRQIHRAANKTRPYGGEPYDPKLKTSLVSVLKTGFWS